MNRRRPTSISREASERGQAARRSRPAGTRARHASRPSTRPRSTEADEQAVLVEMMSDSLNPEDIESGDTLTYRGDGIQDSVWRRLRRGNYHIRAELDLHGLNRDAAPRAVGAVPGRFAWTATSR